MDRAYGTQFKGGVIPPIKIGGYNICRAYGTRDDTYPFFMFVRAKALLFIRYPPGLKSGVSQLYCIGYGHGFKGCLGLGTGFEYHPVA